MGLKEIRSLFYTHRSSCKIKVSSHAFEEYPERGFSKMEIIRLIESGAGNLVINNYPSALDGSYLFKVKDLEGRDCELVVILNQTHCSGRSLVEIKVCSAFRKV